jgi:hypothetical protein
MRVRYTDEWKEMRFLLRFFSLVSLAVATIAGTIDSIRSVAESTVAMTSLGDAWKSLSPLTLEKLQSLVSAENGGRIFNPAVEWILIQPAFAVFLAVALLLWIMAYRRVPAAGRFAA